MKSKVETTYTLELDDKEIGAIIRWSQETKESRKRGGTITWTGLDEKIQDQLMGLVDPDDDYKM